MAKRILVVDDSRAMAMKTCMVLKRAGFETASLTESLDTAAYLQQHPVDLLILDVEMPGKTGYQVCDELRSQPEFDNLPVMFLTTREDHLDRLKGYAVGAQEYVNKDYDEQTLIQHVRKLMGVRAES